MGDVNGELAVPAPVLSAPPADGDLVRRARKGDAEARNELAQRHRRAAYVLALQLLKDPDDAMDVSQDAMLRFFTHLDRFEAHRPVKPWLLAIVRNQARDLWRRRKVRRAESLDAAEEGDLSLALVDASADPERDARRSQLRRKIWHCLSQLTEKKREILVLRDYHDLAYAEIASVLGVPIGTVMSRLHGARKALREILLAEGEELSAERGAEDE